MNRRASGFTLMEMILGLALLGLLTLALFSAMRFGTQSWERVEQRSVEVVDLAIAESLLRREMSKAFPLRVGLANENKIAFEGRSDGLKFVVALPAHFSTGGLSLVQLDYVGPIENSALGGDLVLRHALQSGLETELVEGEGTQQSKLIRGVSPVRFDYFGRESDLTEPGWKTAWPQSARLPQLVRMTFRLSGADDEHELILPLMIGEEAACYQAAFQRQCGPRR